MLRVDSLLQDEASGIDFCREMTSSQKYKYNKVNDTLCGVIDSAHQWPVPMSTSVPHGNFDQTPIYACTSPGLRK